MPRLSSRIDFILMSQRLARMHISCGSSRWDLTPASGTWAGCRVPVCTNTRTIQDEQRATPFDSESDTSGVCMHPVLTSFLSFVRALGEKGFRYVKSCLVEGVSCEGQGAREYCSYVTERHGDWGKRG